jgi:hypothetical protein
MTDPAPAPQRITIEELQGMFGPSIPIEAAQVLWCGLFDPDTARQKLKEIAARPPAAEEIALARSGDGAGGAG